MGLEPRKARILHFCGKAKPWKKGYIYRFGLLYKHYARITARLESRMKPGPNAEV